MQAVIMAGGKGTRLLPLTENTPKPLVAFFDRPLLEHQIDLLKRDGIREIIITVGHLKQRIIDHLGDGDRFGVHIRYVIEESPLGTAGGVKLAESMLSETFVILSGDAITDIRVSEVLAFHEDNQAAVTLVLKHVLDPSQFGIAQTDASDHVLRFYEKPSAAEVFSNCANTGIYVMNRGCLHDIPPGVAYDFSRDLFPALMRQHQRMLGYCMNESYWNDMGSLENYLAGHIDALEGRVQLPLVKLGSGLPESAWMHPTAVTDARCYIGEGARIEMDALIGRNAIVGARARIGRGATLKRCVVGVDCQVGEHAVLEDCILPARTVLPAYSRLGSNSNSIIPDSLNRLVRASI